jgi:hypothetical protein
LCQAGIQQLVLQDGREEVRCLAAMLSWRLAREQVAVVPGDEGRAAAGAQQLQSLRAASCRMRRRPTEWTKTGLTWAALTTPTSRRNQTACCAGKARQPRCAAAATAGVGREERSARSLLLHLPLASPV